MPEFHDDNDDSSEDNLPRLHWSERGETPLTRMRARLNYLDGPMSVSNANVPDEATDIGDVDERPNPRAVHLDYCEAVEAQHSEERGQHFLHDGPHIRLAGGRYVRAGEGTFIEDVTEWA